MQQKLADVEFGHVEESVLTKSDHCPQGRREGDPVQPQSVLLGEDMAVDDVVL